MNSVIILRPRSELSSPSRLSYPSTKSANLRLKNNPKIITIPCQKHNNKNIERIFTYPNCANNIIFCSDCVPESTEHIRNHKDGIVSVDEFVEVCKLNSAASKHKVNLKYN